MYLFIAYKASSNPCTALYIPSDLILKGYLTEDELVEEWARVRSLNTKARSFSERYDFHIYRDGLCVLGVEGGPRTDEHLSEAAKVYRQNREEILRISKRVHQRVMQNAKAEAVAAAFEAERAKLEAAAKAERFKQYQKLRAEFEND